MVPVLPTDEFTEPEPKNAVTGSVMPPRDARVRWHVIPTRSGNGTYWY